MRIIIISIFYFSFLSVFGQTQTEKNLKNCISSVVVNNDYKNSDFYTIMKEMEFRMIKQGVLKGDKKEDYINLFKSLATKSENNIFLKFYKNNFTYLNTNFPFNLFTVNNAIFNQCPYKTSLQQNNDEEKLIYKQGEKLMEIMFSGYCDFTKIEMLIDSYKNTDFNKIINRAPIVYISLINIDNQYNPELIKYLESIKDKKSLNED